MFLKEISLKNVRIFDNLKTEFNPKINIIHGSNGQGKTSILEAIYYLSLTKTFRINRDSVVLKNNSAFFEIIGTYVSDDSILTRCRIFYSNEEGKHAFINSNKINQFSELVGLFPVILLSLDDLNLTFGFPAARRRFMDILLSQLYPGYLNSLKNYKKCITQKNKVLNSEGSINKKDIDIWNQQISELGSEIILHRIRFVDFINREANEVYKKISNNQEKIEARYNSIISGLKPEIGKQEILRLFESTLSKFLESEIKRKMCLVGPHKDDVDFLKNGYLFKSHGSQGENKSFLITLKIIESNYIRQIIKKNPLFLLDDIFGELDYSRVENLVKLLNNEGQTFITTTDFEKFRSIFPQNSKFIHLKSHMIQ